MPNLLGVRPSFATGFAQSAGESEYPELWRGLVGAWDASLGQTGSRLIDWSGKGNHGIKSGNVVWEPGKFGWANHYDGSSGYHDFGNPAALQFLTGDFTFLAWVNVDSEPGDWWTVGGKWSDASADRSYTLATGTGAYNNFLFFVNYAASGLQIAQGTTSASSTIGQWVQVVGVKKGANIYIYVNGVLEGTDVGDAGVLQASSSNFFLGRHTDGWWDGLIGQVLIFNRALIAAEINLLYQLRKQVA